MGVDLVFVAAIGTAEPENAENDENEQKIIADETREHEVVLDRMARLHEDVIEELTRFDRQFNQPVQTQADHRDEVDVRKDQIDARMVLLQLLQGEIGQRTEEADHAGDFDEVQSLSIEFARVVAVHEVTGHQFDGGEQADDQEDNGIVEHLE